MTDQPLMPLVVVFDTNVLIPLIIPASLSARLFLRLQAAGGCLAASPRILDEVRDKMLTKQRLRKWMRVSDQDINYFLTRLPSLCSLVAGHRQAHGAVPADPKDDMIVACALEAQAAYIVTEDKHLLALKQYQGIKIMTRAQFAAELDQLGLP